MAASRLLPLLCLKGQTNSPALSWCLLSRINRALVQQVPVAYMSTKKHYDPKWRKQRRDKVFKMKDMLPNFEKSRIDEHRSMDELRMEMKKEGKLPRQTIDKDTPLVLRSTSDIFDTYEPKVNDGKSMFFGVFSMGKGESEDSMMTDHVTPKEETEEKTIKTTFKDKLLKLKGPLVTFRSNRTLKQYETGFSKKELVHQLQGIYMEALQCLENVKKNEDRLLELITDWAFVQFTQGLDKKTVRWEFIESLEPPKCMHTRVASLMFDNNYYAQITVRMHTRQKLAIYDRFGRLLYGNEHMIKDMLEYIVFEKHIVDVYGRWRIHAKIEPDWQQGFVNEALVTTTREPQKPQD